MQTLIMDITSQIISNQLDNANKFCIHWNQLGEVAYACQNTVQILDSFSMKIHQSFQIPRPNQITKLKWSSIKLSDRTKNDCKCLTKLACADEQANIYVWNTYEQILLSELNDPVLLANQKISDMKWLTNEETNHSEHLIALYNRQTASSALIVWDAVKAVKLFTKAFNEFISHFTLDPYDFRINQVLGTNFIQFSTIENLISGNVQINQNTTRKFYITNQEANEMSPNEMDGNSKKPMNVLTSYFRNFMDVGGGQKNMIENNAFKMMSLKDCLQIEFHPTCANIIFLLYTREIFIFELNINQTVGYLHIDKHQSPFMQLHVCSQNDVLYLLHENGSISVYYRESIQNKLSLFKSITSQQEQKQQQPSKQQEESTIEKLFDNLDKSFSYHLFIQSDQIRLSKNSLVFGMSICPVSQKKLLILLNDGRLLKYELIQKKDYQTYRKNASLVNSSIKSQIYLFEYNFSSSPKNDFKLSLTNMTNSICDLSFICKVCPPLTKKNFKNWQPLLALGSSNGFLYVYNLNKNLLVKKLLLHNHAINGIEWYSINCVLTWSFNTINLSQTNDNISNSASPNANRQMVKNELLLTDLRTGESRSIRDISQEESPIVSAKLSIHKQYLVILFKEQPIEIWDMKNFSLIKKLAKKGPIIKLLEWYPESKKLDNPNNSEQETNKSNIIPATYCENFVCIDEHGLMYSFTIESNHIKDGSDRKLLPHDGLISNVVTSIAIKKDLIVFGDSEGNLIKWDVKARQSKFLTYSKREIKKLKFAPGKENLFLLVQLVDSLEIIDITNMDTFSSFKPSSSKLKIIDCDWCCSDRIVCFFNDNQLKIYDLNFQQTPNSSNDNNPSFTQMPSILRLNQTVKSFKNETNYMLFRNLFYRKIDSIENFTDLDDIMIEKFKNEIINSESVSLNKLLNENLFHILLKVNEKSFNSGNVTLNRKIYAYLLYSIYFNTSRFEITFWSLLLYVLAETELNENFLLFKKQSIFLKKDLFKLNEYQLMKLYKEKQDPRVLNKNNLLIKNLILSNELDYVFNLLLEGEFQSENYMNDYLKACLIASLKNQNNISNSQTSIKLVATNLIANGKLAEGLELLCLIGLVHDACRYMQDNDKWTEAAWLAKVRLNETEYNDVIKRWCDHLCLTGKKELAVLLYLSCRQFRKALEILSTDSFHTNNSYSEIAFYFMNLCHAYNLIDDLDLKQEANANQELNSPTSGHQIHETLINKIKQNHDSYISNQLV